MTRKKETNDNNIPGKCKCITSVNLSTEVYMQLNEIRSVLQHYSSSEIVDYALRKLFSLPYDGVIEQKINAYLK
jgi:hypothetical protein